MKKQNNALEDSVMTVEEVRTGPESRGESFHQLDFRVLLQILERMDRKGSAKIFKGQDTDDLGVKFLR